MTHKKFIKVKRLIKIKFLMNNNDCVYEALNQYHISNSAVNALITAIGKTQEINDKTQLI